MNIRVSCLCCVLVMVATVGCTRDPKVRCARLIASGQQYMAKSQYDAAAIQFQRAIQANPNSAEAHYDLASCLGKLGRWSEAYRELQATTQIEPKHVGAHLASAEILLRARQTENARQEITSALAVEPNNFRAHLLLGNAFVSDHDYHAALDEFTTCERLEPSNPGGYMQAGLVHLAQAAYQDAANAFSQAIKVAPTLASAYLYLAQTHALEGDQKAATATLEEGIAQAPKQAPLYFAAADRYLKGGRKQDIGPLFNKLRSQTSDAPEVLIALGDFYFREGDAQHAREILSQALERNPNNDPVMRRLIEVSLSQQDWDYAEKLNKALIAAKPKDPEARLFEARLQFARGARAKAVDTLQQLVHDSPDLALAHYYLGLAYARQGQSTQAISAFNETVQKSPDFIWAYVELGQLYAQEGTPKLALDFANQALKRNARFLPARLLEATALIESGDAPQAIQELRDLLVHDPKNPAILEKLGFALANQKDYKLAGAQFEAALAANPSYAPALVDLARLYAVEKQPEQIEPRIQLQIQRAPNESKFYELLGDIQFTKRKFDDAGQSYAQAARLNANSANALLGLARTHGAQGKLPEGISDARKLLDLHPDYLVGYIELGQLLEQNGAFTDAEGTYRQALDRNDDFAPALNNLAWLYCEHGGNLDMALGLAQKAKAKFPADTAISDTLGWIEYRKGMYDSAAGALKDVAIRAPQNALYQYHYGMSLLKSSRSNDARKALERAIQLALPDAEATEAKRALASLSAESEQRPASVPLARN